MSDELHAELATTLREHLLGTVGGEAPADEFDCCADALIAGPLAELIRRANERDVLLDHLRQEIGYSASQVMAMVQTSNAAAGSSSGISGKAGQ